MRLAICLPFYNEQDNIQFVLNGLISELNKSNSGFRETTIICIDDSSTDDTPRALTSYAQQLFDIDSAGSKIGIKIIRTNQNSGHQRALWHGLTTAKALKADVVICMDGDGQDDPGAIGAMLELIRFRSCHTVFATRSKRSESLSWRVGYQIFQIFTRVLIGRSLPFGNYSAFSSEVLDAVLRQGFFSHLAATLAASRYPYLTISVPRLPRHAGRSKMRLLSLVDYGISALTTFPEAWTRLFSRIALITFMVCAIVGSVVAGLRVFTSYAYPGWASTVVVGCAILTLQSIGFLVCFAFMSRIINFLQKLSEKEQGSKPYTVIADLNDHETSISPGYAGISKI